MGFIGSPLSALSRKEERISATAVIRGLFGDLVAFLFFFGDVGDVAGDKAGGQENGELGFYGRVAGAPEGKSQQGYARKNGDAAYLLFLAFFHKAGYDDCNPVFYHNRGFRFRRADNGNGVALRRRKIAVHGAYLGLYLHGDESVVAYGRRYEQLYAHVNKGNGFRGGAYARAGGGNGGGNVSLFPAYQYFRFLVFNRCDFRR